MRGYFQSRISKRDRTSRKGDKCDWERFSSGGLSRLEISACSARWIGRPAGDCRNVRVRLAPIRWTDPWSTSRAGVYLFECPGRTRPRLTDGIVCGFWWGSAGSFRPEVLYTAEVKQRVRCSWKEPTSG